MTRSSALLRATAFALGLLLAGCAAQQRFEAGLALLAQGRMAEGLVELDEASRLEPRNAPYRMALVQTRERYVAAQMDRSELLLRQRQFDEAEQPLRQVLALQAGHERAEAGLRRIEQHRRLQRRLEEAQDAASRKDWPAARSKLLAVLAEQPAHAGAQASLREVDAAARPMPPAHASALAAAYRKPITIEFKDVSLQTVFEVIARTSGLNFVFDKDVRTDQKTSIFLKNATIESAVNLTLLTNQLEQRVVDANTVLIYPNTQAKQKDYLPLTIRSFYLTNAEAKTVAATLKTLLKTKDVVVDEKLNLLIVRDTPQAIGMVDRLVALHDLPEPEVMLEVEIVEIKRTRLLDLGVRWPDQLSLTPLASTSGGALTVADLRKLNGSTTGAGIGALTINAKKTDSDANILANPRIRARNREKAKILIGERVPNITATSTATGFVAESINYVDVGLKLEVEPTIYLDGEVAIKVALEVSNIISQVQTKQGSVAFQIGTRNAQTVLRLKDGENQVLAGLINDEDRRTAYKVPGLGEVPVVGRLFGSQNDDASKTEIVLSITPRILRNVQRPDVGLTDFESGTENNLGGSIGTLPTEPETEKPGPAATPKTSGTGPAATAPATADVAAKTGTSLRWQGPADTRVGEEFSLQLHLNTNTPLWSVPVTIGFDARAFAVLSVTEGDLLKSDAARTAFTSRVDPAGQIMLSASRSDGVGATGAGTLATVRFRATSAAQRDAAIVLLNAAPTGQGSSPVAASLPGPHALRVSP